MLDSSLLISGSLLLSLSFTDIHWQCGDLNEPLQVPVHLHSRKGGGVSQQKLLWAQSTHDEDAMLGHIKNVWTTKCSHFWKKSLMFTN